jgi:hypothetical protein
MICFILRWSKNVALAALGTFWFISATEQEPTHEERLQELQQDAFIAACYLLVMDCTKVPPPTLRIEPLVYGELGTFIVAEEHYIYLNSRLEGDLWNFAFEIYNTRTVQAYVVVLHETVHYLDYHVNSNMTEKDGDGSLRMPDLCRSETLAWSVGNLWLTLQHWEEVAVFNWKERYPQCKESSE